MNPSKINSLQVYRAVAALLVVLYHITDQSQSKFGFTFMGNLFSFGFIGVDFFFVLSGFIILYVHSQDIGHQKELKGYLTKRFIRLFPIYWCIASIKILSIYLIPSTAKVYEKDILYMIKSYLLIPQENLPIIGVAWSLSYEVLFYMLFGIAILVGLRWAHRLLIIWSLAIIGFLSLRYLSMPIFNDNLFINFIFNERNLEFNMGCLAVYLIINKDIKFSKIVALIGGALFAFWGMYIQKGNQVDSFTLTIGFAAFLLILGSASFETKKHIKWPRLFVFFGDASYSIYLTHVMFINLLMIIFLKLQLSSIIGPFASSIIIVTLAILGGSFVYLFLEKPLITNLRKKLIKTPSKQLVIAHEAH